MNWLGAHVAYAAELEAVTHFKSLIVNPALKLLMAVAVLVFLWGVAQFIWGTRYRVDDKAGAEGKQHMIWGIVGFAIMVSAFGIVNFIANVVKELR